MSVEIVERNGRLIVSMPFNPHWRDWARTHGGKWDAGSQTWTFPAAQRDEVESALSCLADAEAP